MSHCVFSHEARGDLQHIHSYIAQDNPGSVLPGPSKVRSW